jgi:hypothetical protein
VIPKPLKGHNRHKHQCLYIDFLKRRLPAACPRDPAMYVDSRFRGQAGVVADFTRLRAAGAGPWPPGIFV